MYNSDKPPPSIVYYRVFDILFGVPDEIKPLREEVVLRFKILGYKA